MRVARGGTLLLLSAAVRGAAGAITAAAVLAAVFSGAGAGERATPPAKQARSAMQGAISYTPIPFGEVPGWEEDDQLAALLAFRKSCDRLARDTLARAEGDKTSHPPALMQACAGASAVKPTKASARAFFEQNFTANAISHTGPSGLLTGYYEPLLPGSRTAEGAFQTPLYKRPPELVDLAEEKERAAVGTLSHGRKGEKGIEPFATRAQIDQGFLKGRNLELLYLADPVDVFNMQIQGSGRVKLTDGSAVRVHYDGKNGHPYTSIARYLIDKGLLAADKISMGALTKWLKADLQRAKEVMWQNASYVFFRELQGAEAKGPLGAMNAPLTPGRSLAVDSAHHLLGMPIYVTAQHMSHVSKGGGFNRLMVAQDVGSAIKGPERGDIYFGSGDAAGKLAGSTKHPCKFIVLLPNEAPVRAAVDGGETPRAQ